MQNVNVHAICVNVCFPLNSFSGHLVYELCSHWRRRTKRAPLDGLGHGDGGGGLRVHSLRCPAVCHALPGDVHEPLRVIDAMPDPLGRVCVVGVIKGWTSSSLVATVAGVLAASGGNGPYMVH